MKYVVWVWQLQQLDGSKPPTGFLPFKLLYGREGLVPDEISHVEFSREDDYNLAVENHIEQLVETHNQAMSNDRNYHEKMKLAFDKKKVGKYRLQTLFWGIMYGWIFNGTSRPRARVGLNR